MAVGTISNCNNDGILSLEVGPTSAIPLLVTRIIDSDVLERKRRESHAITIKELVLELNPLKAKRVQER